MSATTKIEWTDRTWNPTRGCSIVSPGCVHCYAMKQAHRFSGPGKAYEGLTKQTSAGPQWTGVARTVESALLEPLSWKKPQRIFVNSMSDLFHEDVPDAFIDQVFAVMALAPRHVFQVLTKRAARMQRFLSDPMTPFRIARASDALAVKTDAAVLTEEIRPIAGFPGYFVSNLGRVLSSSGSARCLFCGGAVDGIATKAYCSKKCKQNANYYRRVGRPRQGESTLVEMSPDVGEQGHMRVMLYARGVPCRQLLHRLVLTTFVRSANEGEQGCHRDGDPTNNALPNLRWGSHEDNWADRKRHGNAHSHGASRDLSAPPIPWPLPNCWAGVSVEDQPRADERIPMLLQTPAAVRFISAEPLLSPVDLTRINLGIQRTNGYGDRRIGWNALTGWESQFEGDTLRASRSGPDRRLSWVIVGGESGSGARFCDLAWIRDIVQQCHAASVPVFVKQLGSVPMMSELSWREGSLRRILNHRNSRRVPSEFVPILTSDKKGGLIGEFPSDLQVRQFPSEANG